MHIAPRMNNIAITVPYVLIGIILRVLKTGINLDHCILNKKNC